jgi:hypothetical protein
LTGGSHWARARRTLLNGLGNKGISNPFLPNFKQEDSTTKTASLLDSRDHQIKSTKSNRTMKKYGKRLDVGEKSIASLKISGH